MTIPRFSAKSSVYRSKICYSSGNMSAGISFGTHVSTTARILCRFNIRDLASASAFMSCEYIGMQCAILTAHLGIMFVHHIALRLGKALFLGNVGNVVGASTMDVVKSASGITRSARAGSAIQIGTRLRIRGQFRRKSGRRPF